MNPLDKKQILYCDNHLLVVNKPAEVLTQPDLVEAAKDWIKRTYQKPGRVFLEAIHRLDKPASGLVLCARTSKALSRLQLMMRERKIQKTYYALVSQFSHPAQGRLVHYIKHGSFCAQVFSSGSFGAKEAILDYQVTGQTPKGILLEIDLITGRYHQIRAQLAHVGSPIVGDVKYGSHQAFPRGIALRSVKMAFEHPVTRQMIQVVDYKDF